MILTNEEIAKISTELMFKPKFKNIIEKLNSSITKLEFEVMSSLTNTGSTYRNHKCEIKIKNFNFRGENNQLKKPTNKEIIQEVSKNLGYGEDIFHFGLEYIPEYDYYWLEWETEPELKIEVGDFENIKKIRKRKEVN